MPTKFGPTQEHVPSPPLVPAPLQTPPTGSHGWHGWQGVPQPVLEHWSQPVLGLSHAPLHTQPLVMRTRSR